LSPLKFERAEENDPLCFILSVLFLPLPRARSHQPRRDRVELFQ